MWGSGPWRLCFLPLSVQSMYIGPAACEPQGCSHLTLQGGGVCSCVCSVEQDSAPLYVCVWGARFFLIQRCSLKLPVPWLFLLPLFFYFRLSELGSSAGCFVGVFGLWATC